MFQGLGKRSGKFTIVTDKSVKPVVHPSQRLPVPMSKQVQRSLRQITADDVIARVDQPAD